MKTYYVTMGQSHVHSCAGVTIDKDCVATFEAVDYNAAEDYTYYLFKHKYCMLHDEEPDMSFYPRGLIEV